MGGRGNHESKKDVCPKPHNALFRSKRIPRTLKVWRQCFYMKDWGHDCCKKTLLWSTSKSVGRFYRGPLPKGSHRSAVRTVIKYVDKNGKVRYKGTKALKTTQLLDCNEKYTHRGKAR